MGFFSGGDSSSDLAQFRRINQKLDLILRHLGLEYQGEAAGTGLSAEVRQLADAGQKIQAIKQLREETGLGLKEAKDAVEAYLGEG